MCSNRPRRASQTLPMNDKLSRLTNTLSGNPSTVVRRIRSLCMQRYVTLYLHNITSFSSFIIASVGWVIDVHPLAVHLLLLLLVVMYTAWMSVFLMCMSALSVYSGHCVIMVTELFCVWKYPAMPQLRHKSAISLRTVLCYNVLVIFFSLYSSYRSWLNI